MHNITSPAICLRCSRVLCALLLLLTSCAVAQPVADSDGDGLSDEQEQFLLEKFRPSFMVSASDCAVLPSRFEPNQLNPKASVADGTIYGQVFRILNSDRIELHYYTLWDKDCGRIRHPLDVEHVSVLLSGTDVANAKALYWYSGAHEKTACDISSGARALAVSAEDRGPVVWSSSGKHALYLRKEMCGHGCGADTCDDNVKLAHDSPVINIGELGAPANGSAWITSVQWRLAEKMASDFPPAVLARLEATSGDTVLTLGGNSTIRGTIQGSDLVLGSAALGTHEAGSALDIANDHTSRSLGKATRATGGALKSAWRFVFRTSPPGQSTDKPK